MANSTWNDDERDTSHHLKYEQPEKEHMSLKDVLKSLHRDESETKYRWTYENYKEEVEKRKMKNTVNAPDVYEDAPEITPNVEPEDDTETDAEQIQNGEIMDKEIYKKCLYS